MSDREANESTLSTFHIVISCSLALRYIGTILKTFKIGFQVLIIGIL